MWKTTYNPSAIIANKCTAHWLILKDFFEARILFITITTRILAMVKNSTIFSYFGVVQTIFNPEISNHVQTNLKILILYQFKIQHNLPRKKQLNLKSQNLKKDI